MGPTPPPYVAKRPGPKGDPGEHLLRVRHGGFASAYGARSSGRYAPSHARWKTLTRFLSLATLMGSNPPHVPDKSPDAVRASGHWI